MTKLLRTQIIRICSGFFCMIVGGMFLFSALGILQQYRILWYSELSFLGALFMILIAVVWIAFGWIFLFNPTVLVRKK